jgi:NADH-quinone oxidoreductase subunit N
MLVGVAGAAAASLFGAWGRRTGAVIAAVAGLGAGSLLATYQALLPAVWSPALPFGNLAAVAVVACLVLGAIVIAASTDTLTAGDAGHRIAALSALAASAAAALAAATDLLAVFLAVETLALCGYALVALGGTDRARESAMKWFVQGSVATAVFIVGLGVLLARTGGSLAYTSIARLASAPTSSVPLAVGFALVLAALAFKAGAFPFHSWMPDAFETAPASATAVLASAGKVGPLAAAVWLTLAVGGATGDRIAPVAAVLAVGSIVFGNLAALRQRSLARMLAYSGIAQVGYALVGLALGGAAVTVIVFAVLYGATSAASFLFVVAVHGSEPAWDGSIAGLAGLSRRRPVLAVSLAVIMLSLTGIPLTAGFWGKFVIFAPAATGPYLWLAVVAMLGSVVSFGYYGAVLRSAFMDEVGPTLRPISVDVDAPAGEAAPVASSPATVATVLLAALIVAIGVLPFVIGLPALAGLVP